MPLTFVEIGSCHFWVARWCDWEGYIGKYEFRSCHACNTSRMSSVCKKCFDEHQCLQLGPPNTWLIVHRLNRMSKCEMVLADRLCTTPGNGCNFHSNLLGSLTHFPSSRPSSPCRYNASVFFQVYKISTNSATQSMPSLRCFHFESFRSWKNSSLRWLAKRASCCEPMISMPNFDQQKNTPKEYQESHIYIFLQTPHIIKRCDADWSELTYTVAINMIKK